MGAGIAPTKAEMLKVINRMVAEGKLELITIDGKPGVRLVKKDKENETENS